MPAQGPLTALRRVSAAWLAAASLLSPAWAGPARDAGSTSALSLAAIYPGARIERQSAGLYDVEFRPEERGWVRDVLGRVDSSRREVARRALDAFLVRITIIMVPDRDALMRLVGDWAENSAAVAVPSRRTVIINVDAVRQSPPEELSRLLTHEFSHILTGLRCGGRPMPRWLDEGIAMHMAREWSETDAALLSMAALLGRLIPLRDLQDGFPVAAGRQHLAYQQSFSVVGFLIANQFDGSLPAMLASLCGQPAADATTTAPARSSAALDALWSPPHRDALELRWRSSLATWKTYVQAMLNSGLFWTVTGLLTLMAYFVVRRRRRRLHEEWADEERIYEALDEEDRRIHGDNEHLHDDEGGDDDEPPPPPHRFHRPTRRW